MMNRTFTYLFTSSATALGVILSLLIPADSWAQLTHPERSGQQGAPRIQKISARTAALGDATVGDPTEISVINVNPAGLAFVNDLKEAQINISQNWNNNVMLENITLPAFQFKNHSVAAQFSIHHDRGLESLNFLGVNPLPQPKITMYQLDVVYSVTIADVLSFGVLNNFSHAENSIAQFSTYHPTLGIMYAPSGSVSYGIAFRGLGRSIVYNVVNTSATTLGSQDLRESLELGAALQFPGNADQTHLSIVLSNEKRFGETGVWYKAGFEWTAFSYLALRTGIIFKPENDVYAPRFGTGIGTDFFTLDYAVSYSNDLYERFHQLGITLHLDRF